MTHYPWYVQIISSHLIGARGLREILTEAGMKAELAEDVRRCPEPGQHPTPDVFLIDTTAIPKPPERIVRSLALAYPHAKFLLLVPDNLLDEEFDLAVLMASGVLGAVRMDQVDRALVSAVEMVAQGSLCLPPELVPVLANLHRALQPRPDAPQIDWTPRQRTILALIARGLLNREIASVLELTEGTVKTYISEMLSKAGAASRRELTGPPLSADHQNFFAFNHRRNSFKAGK
jgi:two-component system response regulator DevR